MQYTLSTFLICNLNNLCYTTNMESGATYTCDECKERISTIYLIRELRKWFCWDCQTKYIKKNK